MASLDDIWDAPVSPQTTHRIDTDTDDDKVQRQHKRQKQALFLFDSEDEGSGMSHNVVKAAPVVNDPGIDNDVEALFEDAENDEGLSFKRTGDLDMAAMEREAQERHLKPLTPHPIMPSSSLTRNNGPSGDAPRGSKNDRGNTSQKRIRPVPLNESLLLGPTGFPELISLVKDFKVKGKGREAEDLTRLMRVYNFWTHKLHPKLKFHDTVVRIEKICHTKRMQVALSVWRDEAHGKRHEIDGDLSSSDSNDDNAPARRQNNKNPTSEALATPHSLSLHPEIDHNRPSLPPSSRNSTSGLTDDDNHLDPSTPSHSRPNGTSSSSASAGAKKRIIVDDDVEDESFWKDLEVAQTPHLMQQQSSESHMAPTQFADNLDDAEMWVAFGEGINQSSARSEELTSKNAPTISKQVDEMDIDDDDVWDIIRKNEKPAPIHSLVITELAAVIAEPALCPTMPSSEMKLPAESEMDWDDVYAD